MSGDVRDRAFTFQAGREIQEGGFEKKFSWFYTVKNQYTSFAGS